MGNSDHGTTYMYSIESRLIMGVQGPLDASFRALSGRLKFAVRREELNTNSPPLQGEGKLLSRIDRVVTSLLDPDGAPRTLDPAPCTLHPAPCTPHLKTWTPKPKP